MLVVENFEASFNLAKSLYGSDTATSKTYQNAKYHSFGFDINETCSPSDSANMSFKDYISGKLNILNYYLGKGDSRDWSELYLRGNFLYNDWQNHEEWRFQKIEDGVYAVNVEVDNKFKFKVYDNKTGTWYNTVDNRCNAEFEYQGDHRNIEVPAGSYTVLFYTETLTVYFVKNK